MGDRIVKTPGILSGKPRVKGYRISVEDVLLYARAGATHKEILKHYPDLTKEDIDACIEYSRKERKHSKRSDKEVA